MGASDSKPSPRREGFEPSVVGKVAECDGGGPVLGTRYASRQEFRGTLTGAFVDHGDPPWRWYLMDELTMKPPAYQEDVVWCEAATVFILEGSSSEPPGPQPVPVSTDPDPDPSPVREEETKP
jgi:hypothetical protein